MDSDWLRPSGEITLQIVPLRTQRSQRSWSCVNESLNFSNEIQIVISAVAHGSGWWLGSCNGTMCKQLKANGLHLPLATYWTVLLVGGRVELGMLYNVIQDIQVAACLTVGLSMCRENPKRLFRELVTACLSEIPVKARSGGKHSSEWHNWHTCKHSSLSLSFTNARKYTHTYTHTHVGSYWQWTPSPSPVNMEQ